MVDVKVSLVDGSFHAVDSSEMAFRIAASMAVKEALRRAGSVLLEPVMELQVITPGDYLGDVLGDLGARRGRIKAMDGEGTTQVLEAEVPLAEVQRYSQDLRSVSQGRGTYSLEFDHYDQVPANLEPKVIEEAKRAKEEEAV